MIPKSPDHGGQLCQPFIAGRHDPRLAKNQHSQAVTSVNQFCCRVLCDVRMAEDAIAAISPYLTEHINRFGDYTLNLGRKPPQPDYSYTIARFTSVA